MKSSDHIHPLKRPGLSAFNRRLKALSPDTAKLMDLSSAQLLEFANAFAEVLKFPSNVPNETWSQVGFSGLSPTAFAPGEWPAHSALFYAFAQLFEHSQDQLNGLVKRHLDHYYKEILQIQPKPAVADKVFLTFDLKKNLTSGFIPASSIFDAGKDEAGQPIQFQALEELVLNTATVGELKSIYKHPTEHTIHIAPVANSLDGLGEAFPEDNTSWPAFGYEALPKAALGFALASPLLNLSEGKRSITIKMGFKNTALQQKYSSLFQAYLTGEEGWVGPIIPQITGQQINGGELTISLQLSEEDASIVPYDQEVHGEHYQADTPMIKLVLNEEKYSTYYPQFSSAKLRFAEIQVDVDGLQNLQVANDLGEVDATKPFNPFTTQPKRGSLLKIGHEELINKPLDEVEVAMTWQDPPSNFKTHYQNYTDTPVTVASNQHFKVLPAIIGGKKNNQTLTSTQLFKHSNTASEFKINLRGSQAVSVAAKSSTEKVYAAKQKFLKVHARNYQVRYVHAKGSNSYNRFRYKQPQQKRAISKAKDPLHLLSFRLETDFLHQYYPLSFSKAMIQLGKATTDAETEAANERIPLEPYTPVADSISVNYKASATLKLGDANHDQFVKRSIQFFQIGAFGQAEKHRFINNTSPTLMANYDADGYFLIGIDNYPANSVLKLLIQVDKGTEEIGLNLPEIDWQVLDNNQWLALEGDQLLATGTNGFLQPGILQVQLQNVDTSHTLLPTGKTWIRAVLQGNTQQAANVINVHAQSLCAERIILSNEITAPIELGAGTIKKAITNLPQVKTIHQYYESFDGRPTEQSEDYYLRVSERLKHNDRAVSLGDYEKLIFEAFPQVGKVKCFSHTTTESTYAPGHVLVVVVPNKERSQVLNFSSPPKINQDTLSDIEAFIGKRSGKLIQLKACNPTYESITCAFKVRFNNGLDFNYYRAQTNQALNEWLAPWIKDESISLPFGDAISQMQVLYFLENLPYVDIVTDLSMTLDGSDDEAASSLQPSSAFSLFVGNAAHIIQPFTECL